PRESLFPYKFSNYVPVPRHGQSRRHDVQWGSDCWRVGSVVRRIASRNPADFVFGNYEVGQVRGPTFFTIFRSSSARVWRRAPARVARRGVQSLRSARLPEFTLTWALIRSEGSAPGRCAKRAAPESLQCRA